MSEANFWHEPGTRPDKNCKIFYLTNNMVVPFDFEYPSCKNYWEYQNVPWCYAKDLVEFLQKSRRPKILPCICGGTTESGLYAERVYEIKCHKCTYRALNETEDLTISAWNNFMKRQPKPVTDDSLGIATKQFIEAIATEVANKIKEKNNV